MGLISGICNPLWEFPDKYRRKKALVRNLIFVLTVLLISSVNDVLAGNYDWEFKDANSTAGWTLEGIINGKISNGVWKFTATEPNPRIFSPKVRIDAENWKCVEFRMRLGRGVQANGRIRFITDQHSQWDDQVLVPFACKSDGQFHNYKVDMSNNLRWKGVVTQLLFEPLYGSAPLLDEQREIEIESLAVINIELATGLYGFQNKTARPLSAVAEVNCANSMSVRYIRIEKTGDLDFVEMEAYDVNKINVAFKKSVSVSTLAWGDGSPGNDGSLADGGVSPIVMMRDPGINWWEVDLGKETLLTHIVIHMRDYNMTGGYCSINGAAFSILDAKRNSIAACQLEAKASQGKVIIPMDKAYFRHNELKTRFGVQSDPPKNICAYDNGCLRLVVPEPMVLVDGIVAISDIEGRNVLKMPLSRGKGSYELPLSQRGYYCISATANYDGNFVITKKTSAAIIGRPLGNPTRLKSIFGVQGEGQAAVEIGAAWSWSQIMTHQVWKTTSGYEWAPQMAGKIKNGKLNLSPNMNWIVMFTYLPEFMQSIPPAQRGNSPTSPPNDYEEFVHFIKWVTSFIPDFVKYVAPIGEPSHSFKGSHQDLAKYHEVIAQTIKEIRPEIRVIGPMMSPGTKTSLESIKALDKLGMFSHLDGISINPYVVAPFRSRMPEADFIEFVDAVIHHFASTGRPDYPVYLTEFGFYIDSDANELTQARYSCRAAILLAMRPTIKLANFFLLGGDGWGYSYLNSDGAPRPVYPAMAHTFRWLSDCSSGTCINLTTTLYVVVFKKSQCAAVAIWDTNFRPIIEISPDLPIKSIQDMFGRSVDCGNRRFIIGQSPIFVELSDASLLSHLPSADAVPGLKLISGGSTHK